MQFTTQTYGKWILTGEHTVLRGGPALVFPLLSLSLKLFYVRPSVELEISCQGKTGPEYHLLVFGLLDRACELLGVSRHELSGSFVLDTDLPLGGGLGASAALCVAVTQLFHHWGHVKEEDQYDFARRLENLFHGESSGVDIAVSLLACPLKFYRSGPREELEIAWKPKLFISYSGERGLTQKCVEKVKSLMDKDYPFGHSIDERMIRATKMAFTAILDSEGELQNQSLLASAIELGASCFLDWELITPQLEKEMNHLKKAGARAVKPTGSGGGGFVLSLWDSQPTDEQISSLKLISCFAD